MASNDQCALGNNGELKDASEIQWYNDPDDENPINPISLPGPGLRRGTRKRDLDKLSSITAADKLDDEGNLKRKFASTRPQLRTRPRKSSKKSTADIPEGGEDDSGDDDFEAGSSEASESEDDGENDVSISNSELADSLPAKTIPSTGRYSGKRKCAAVTVQDVEDVDSPDNLRERSKAPISGSILELDEAQHSTQTKRPKTSSKRNPIYYFFETVACAANGTRGKEGDKHYKCYHGNHHITTVTATMKIGP